MHKLMLIYHIKVSHLLLEQDFPRSIEQTIRAIFIILMIIFQ